MSSTIVVVTGGSGYIASHICQQLLEKGYHVRASVRKIGSQSSKHLTKETLCPDAPGTLELFEADLLKEGTFDKACEGAKYVLHTASPFLATKLDDPQTQLVDPAVNGTVNVLEACNKSSTVQRVVLTSSVVAIHAYANDKGPGHVYTDKDWNERSTLTKGSYPFSKVMAEKKAWEMSKADGCKWDLTTIHPSLVLGPTLSGRSNDGTFDIMTKILDGSYYMAMNLWFGCVDVRDVAKSHILAMEKPEANGRYICCNKSLKLKEIGDLVKKVEPKYTKTPSIMIPKPVAKYLGFAFGIKKDFVVNNVNFTLEYDNSRVQKELGLEFIDLEVTIKDMVKNMEEHKMV